MMDKKLYLLFGLLLICLSCNFQKKNPNVVLIVADDFGYTDLGCYGSSFYETPHLDRLAQEGIKFTNGYASCPVCSPTRASIQTGKYPVKTNITDWIPGRASYTKPSPRDRLLSAPLDNQLAHKEITIAEVLREKGYKTFFAGKWHLGQDSLFWPEYQGYEINKGGYRKGAPNLNRKKTAEINCGGYFSPYCNPRLQDGPMNEYLPERLAQETVTFIRENKNDPFFVSLQFYLVHTPLQAKEEMIENYTKKGQAMGLDTIPHFEENQEWMAHASEEKSRYRERIVQGHPVYASMVEALDENIGKVLSILAELELDKNTLIIFTSDNGGLSTAEGSPTSNLPLRAGKGWLYEGGIRVPYIMKYPENKNPGSSSRIPISSIDVFPTILSYTGINPGKYTGIDGIDLWPYLNSGEYPQRNLFWHYPHYANQGGNPGSVILSGDYKLIHDFETGKMELYNLDKDMGELNNIAAENPDKVNEMYNELEQWRRSTGAKMMKSNPGWNGDTHL
jgi:arylsulfatase A-like enzyme